MKKVIVKGIVLFLVGVAFLSPCQAQARRIKEVQTQKPEWLNIYPTTDTNKISPLLEIFIETVWSKEAWLAGNLQYVVAEDTRSGKIVGGFSYSFPSIKDRVTIIGLMAVTPERQKEGIGSFLAQELFNIAHNLGYRTIQLRVRDEALPFWLRCGGRIIQEIGKPEEAASDRQYIIEFNLE